MQFFTRIKLAVLTSLFAAGAASAVPVTGSINIASVGSAFTVNYGTNNVTFVGGDNASVTNATGSYFGLNGATVHYNNFTYDPLSITNPLWQTTSGAPAAEFNLTGISFIEKIPGTSLALRGWGTVKVDGFDNTPGTWNFKVTQNGADFSWNSINQPVPDGGASVALLGASLLGLAGARRFLKK